MFTRFLECESGATAIEYGLMTAIIAIFAITGLRQYHESLGALFNYVATTVENAMTTTG